MCRDMDPQSFEPDPDPMPHILDPDPHPRLLNQPSRKSLTELSLLLKKTHCQKAKKKYLLFKASYRVGTRIRIRLECLRIHVSTRIRIRIRIKYDLPETFYIQHHTLIVRLQSRLLH